VAIIHISVLYYFAIFIYIPAFTGTHFTDRCTIPSAYIQYYNRFNREPHLLGNKDRPMKNGT